MEEDEEEEFIIVGCGENVTFFFGATDVLSAIFDPLARGESLEEALEFAGVVDVFETGKGGPLRILGRLATNKSASFLCNFTYSSIDWDSFDFGFSTSEFGLKNFHQKEEFRKISDFLTIFMI